MITVDIWLVILILSIILFLIGEWLTAKALDVLKDCVLELDERVKKLEGK